MSDVNKQLLDAVKHCHGIFDQYVSHHLAKPDYDKAAANERHRAICAEAIAAAEQAQQADHIGDATEMAQQAKPEPHPYAGKRKGHPDGDFSYRCGSDYCRCAQ